MEYSTAHTVGGDRVTSRAIRPDEMAINSVDLLQARCCKVPEKETLKRAASLFLFKQR